PADGLEVSAPCGLRRTSRWVLGVGPVTTLGRHDARPSRRSVATTLGRHNARSPRRRTLPFRLAQPSRHGYYACLQCRDLMIRSVSSEPIHCNPASALRRRPTCAAGANVLWSSSADSLVPSTRTPPAKTTRFG